MKIALVGPTGCGKSTLVNLLMRFYDPTWGEIRLDGVPIRTIPTRTLRRQIGVVLQDPVVFRLSLADNIRYGAPAASDAQVEAAAKAARVHEFAMALPDGYATIVGEGGHKLSQGERQRLAIARALCKEPALVVLDEATSSLDTPSEALIQAALANLLRGRTAFIIAHRLSTIVDADRIVVMDGGLIVQMGTHAQLMADREGLYRRLCARQFGEPVSAIASRPSTASAGRPRSVASSRGGGLMKNRVAHEGKPVLHLLTIAPCGGVVKGDITGCMEFLTMDFSLIDYLDEDACYTKLVELLHPDGLACPRCGERQHLGIHRCHRAPWWTSSVARAAGSSTPSPRPPCRGPIAGPRSC